MCSASAAAGIGARWAASGCWGETTIGTLTAKSGRRVSVGGTRDQDPTTPTAQRPSTTGSTTALDSTSKFNKVEGKFLWKAATAAVNGAGGNITSTATLNSGSRPPARLFARALKRSTSPATA